MCSCKLSKHYPRANGAKRRSGRKPGARVTNSARLFTPGPGKCVHSEVRSHPPLCNGRSTLDGFRRYAHARVQAESGLVSIKLVIG